MHIRSIALIISFFAITSVCGQTFEDALRFSRFDVLGTARTVGVGGGLGALGTDFAVMSINPASVALTRRDEIVFSPGIWLPSTISSFLDQTNRENNAFFNINNLGVVFHSTPREFNWSTFNFAIGFNRLADFNREFYWEGANRGSITDDFLAIANGNVGADFFNIDPFGTYVANQALAVYQFDGENFYRTDFEQAPNAQVRKNQRVRETGSMNEIVFGFGANFKEKVMFGLNIGVPVINFEQNKTYQENDPNDDIPQFEELEYRESLSTTAAGFNAKIGLIYRFNQAFRAGLAVHTPTFFRLDDSFDTEMDYSYIEGNQIFSETGFSPEGTLAYRLQTPWRFIGSAGYIVGKYGFLTGEVEYVDYSSAQFRYDGLPEDERIVNDEIAAELQSAINIRLGGEIAVEKFRIRGGIGLLQPPEVEDTEGFNTTFSVGLGLRERIFYIDAAYRLFDSTEEEFIPIIGDPNAPPIVRVFNEDRRSLVVLTLGLRL